MPNPSTPVRAAVAATLACASSLAQAQLQFQGTFTLVSAALPDTVQVDCTVTNVSNQSVTLTNVTNQSGVYITKLEIIDRGTVLGSNSCWGVPLAPGMSCSRAASNNVDPSAPQPYCRAQYHGPEGAVLGSFYGNYSDLNFGPANSGPVLPLRQLKGVTHCCPVKSRTNSTG